MLALGLSFVMSSMAQADTTKTATDPAHTTGKKTATKSGGVKSSKAKTSAKTHTAARTSASHSSTATHPSATHRKPAVASSRGARGRRSRSKKTARGQQKIDPQRAEEIQEALIREHYLTGDPTGKWDQTSEDALRRYQADHGWQSKMVPDSRALISLGLGPSHDHLLNPDSAMTTGPEVVHPAAADSTSSPPRSHSAEPEPASTSPAPVADPSSPNTSASQHQNSNPQK